MFMGKRACALMLVLLSSAAPGVLPSASADEAKTISVIDYQQPKSAWNDFYDRCSQATGYKFKRLTVPQGDIITKTVQLTAGGKGPNIVLSDGDQLPAFAAAGVVQPLDMAAIGVRAEDFVSGPYSAGTFEGKQYGLPVGSNGEIIIYNIDMLNKAGISPPKSWKDLQSAAKALTHDGVYGFAVTMATGETGAWNFLAPMWSNGGNLPNLSSPKTVEALEFWTSLLKAGASPTAQLHWQSNDIEGEFVAGKLAMGQIGTWELADLVHDATAHHVAYGSTPQVSPTGEPALTPFGGEVLSIGVSSKGDVLKAVNRCIAMYQEPDSAVNMAGALGFVPDLKAAIEPYLKQHPENATLSEQLKNSRSRTTEVGPKYPVYSSAISAAMQAVAIGQKSAKDALKEAEAQVAQ
jgi:multiple sugar transport system substrate-binding protein